MRIAKLTFALFVCLLLWGCATGAKKENMAFISEQKNYPEELPENLQIGKVSVVEQGKLAMFTAITSEAFASALEDSLKSQGLFFEDGNYLLEVNVFEIDSPSLGLTYKVTTHAQYTLTSTNNGEVIFDETVVASHTATMEDSLVATDRLTIANEGSAQKNIGGFLEKLSEL